MVGISPNSSMSRRSMCSTNATMPVWTRPRGSVRIRRASAGSSSRSWRSPLAEILACFSPSAAGLTTPQRRDLAVALLATAPDKCPEELTTWYAGWAEPAAVAWLVSQAEELRIDPDPILEAIARRRDFQDVCATLHRQGSHRLAYLIVAIRAEYRL
jgi:hypothetical protein